MTKTGFNTSTIPSTPNPMNSWIELANCALLLSEVVWSSGWYTIMVQPEGGWGLTIAALLGLAGSTYLTLKILNIASWGSIVRRIFMGVWILFWMIASLKILIFPGNVNLLNAIFRPISGMFENSTDLVGDLHLIFVLLLLWRSVRLVSVPTDLHRTVTSFQVGLAALIVLGIALSRIGSTLATLLPGGLTLFLYLTAILIAMISARIASLGELRGSRLPRFSRSWLIGTGLSTLGVAALAVIGGLGLSRPLGQLLNWLVSTLIRGIFTALGMAGYPLLQIAEKIGRLLQPLYNQFASRPPEIQQYAPLIPNEGDNPIRQIFNILQGLLVFGVIIFIIVMIIKGLRETAQANRNLEEEGVMGSGEIFGRRSLRNLTEQWIRSRRFLRPGQILAAAQIRQIYNRLMVLCTKLALPRPPATTPLEFLPAMQDLFDENKTDLVLITSAYLRVRYGEFPESRQEVQEVLAAWDRVRQSARKPKVA